VWTGFGVFTGFYMTALIGAGGDDPAGEWLFIPVAGPLLYNAHRQCPSPCDDTATGAVMMTFAAGQATGIALFAAGFLLPKRWLVPDFTTAEHGPRFALVPRIDRSNAGLAMLGDF
jgi:hypothetical protein